MRQFLVEAVSGDHPLPGLLETLAQHGVDAAGFVDTLTRRCAGVWIYLRYVLDDIVAGRRSPRDVASLPDGLVGYYLEQIHRWAMAPDWSAVGSPALATLVALRRPASRDDLTGHTGWMSGIGWGNGVCAVPLPDGRTLVASAGDDGTVRLWDPASVRPVGGGHLGTELGGAGRAGRCGCRGRCLDAVE